MHATLRENRRQVPHSCPGNAPREHPAKDGTPAVGRERVACPRNRGRFVNHPRLGRGHVEASMPCRAIGGTRRIEAGPSLPLKALLRARCRRGSGLSRPCCPKATTRQRLRWGRPTNADGERECARASPSHSLHRPLDKRCFIDGARDLTRSDGRGISDKTLQRVEKPNANCRIQRDLRSSGR